MTKLGNEPLERLRKKQKNAVCYQHAEYSRFFQRGVSSAIGKGAGLLHRGQPVRDYPILGY